MMRDDKISAHELTPVVHIIRTIVDEQLRSHPAIRSNPKLVTKANDVQRALSELHHMLSVLSV